MTSSSPGTASPYLTTDEAAVYLRYRSASGVRKAIARGVLVPDGRGPHGAALFRTSTLDAFISTRARVHDHAANEAPRRLPAPRRPLPDDQRLPRPAHGLAELVEREQPAGRARRAFLEQPANDRPRRRGQHTPRVARAEVAEMVAERMRRTGR